MPQRAEILQRGGRPRPRGPRRRGRRGTGRGGRGRCDGRTGDTCFLGSPHTLPKTSSGPGSCKGGSPVGTMGTGPTQKEGGRIHLESQTLLGEFNSPNDFCPESSPDKEEVTGIPESPDFLFTYELTF